MSVTALIVSTVLLSVLLFVRYYEYSQRNTRIFGLFRNRLDRTVRTFFLYIVRKMKFVFEYVHKDIVLNVLHMLTYVALFMVRGVERRLEKVTIFLRSFKKNRKKQKKVIQSEHEHNE